MATDVDPPGRERSCEHAKQRVNGTHDHRSDHDRLFPQGIKTVLHPVSDLATAKAVYAALLGIAPQTDSSYYVGFEAEGQHIGLVPGGGPQGMTAPVAYWHVPDIEAKLAEMTAAGATVKEAAHEVGDGRLVATVTDPDGNVLGLLQDR
ncbi:VOC family protein [Streptosporangium canum]|uniref:VOC family protein n=1 Tax=Streptosporangium canum TaxID=324952 RepID=UPI00378FD688